MIGSILSAARHIAIKDLQFLRSQKTLEQSSYLKSSLERCHVEQEVMPTETEQLNITRDVVGRVNAQIAGASHGRLFAVVRVSGQQFMVTEEDLLVVKRHFEPRVGDKIRLEKVLVVGGSDFTLVGRPLLAKDLVRVDATVVENTLSATKVLFKYRPKKKRINFERTPHAVLRITGVRIEHPVDGLPSVQGVDGRVF